MSLQVYQLLYLEVINKGIIFFNMVYNVVWEFTQTRYLEQFKTDKTCASVDVCISSSSPILIPMHWELVCFPALFLSLDLFARSQNNKRQLCYLNYV